MQRTSCFPGRATKPRGFTLIEMMVAVAMLALLVGLALPSLQDAIRKGRRADAVAALNAVQLAQERWRANNPSYTDRLTELPTASPPGLGLSATSSNGYYAIALSGISATGYTATATAVTGTSQANDRDCARLRVRMAGGNLFYGSSSLGGSFDEGTGNLCWSR